ncbi:MAG: tetratricopeptide repeat protein [Phycisphaerae bacterium]
MSRRKQRRSREQALPILDEAGAAPRPRRNFGRWRALTLSLVYLAFAAHIIHWKLSGKTLAPLELNEVMYTLELGIITAGFLFMCFLVLGTSIFGRFFCSWACHILVLQDFCAWLLSKLGIRRKPIRSRLLLLVPVFTALYMFIWPQFVRAWRSRAIPEFHFQTDAEGWASFLTNNFWRNLPSAPIIIVTFMVCGFLIVYLLGSRTFCTYVCPYGAVFALADRFAIGRIRSNDKCEQCGTCTAACTSGIRVHDELRLHGTVVNPACMKDLDCVSACPHDALHYGFTAPALFKSFKSGGRFGRLPYDFTWGEDALMGVMFLIGLLTFRGLYGRVPFLLSLAVGGILGYLAVLTVRLWTRSDVVLALRGLKHGGQWTHAGRVYVAGVALLAVFIGHSAFVHYHEYRGLRQTLALAGVAPGSARDEQASAAYAHLATADRWGLLHNERVEADLMNVSLKLGRFDEVGKFAARLLKSYPGNGDIRVRLGKAYAAQGRSADARREFERVITQESATPDEPSPALASAHHALGELFAEQGSAAAAMGHLRAAVKLDPDRAAVHAELGSILADTGQLDAAVASLREALRLDPHLGKAQYNLGTILAHMGRFDEAIPCYWSALETLSDDTDLHNNLGFALMRTGRIEECRKQFLRAVALDPNNANAHFNLAAMLASQQRLSEAEEHYRIAARLDPRYAKLLAD